MKEKPHKGDKRKKPKRIEKVLEIMEKLKDMVETHGKVQAHD